MKRSLVLWISAIGAVALALGFAKVSGVNAEAKSEKLAVVVVGHGIPPRDFPREKLRELRRLHAEIDVLGGEEKAPPNLVERYRTLEKEVRQYPRTPENDPYDAAVKELAQRVKEMGNFPIVIVTHNEFCGLDVDEGIEEAIKQGAKKVIVISTMFIKGGTHNEKDIPGKIEKARRKYPNTPIIYAYPYDTDDLAMLMVNTIQKHGQLLSRR
ncbi:CbiX protein [Candidatus Fervidibacteria bacterium JGI MDM2 SSWTFF-3-K9]